MRLGPGCCCVTVDCTIGSDTFSTTNDPPTGWTEASGSDWATNSSYLSTATDNAALRFNTAHPDAISSGIVEVSVYGADTDELRVLIDYTDVNNYRFAQLTIGDPNGCLALYERSGGSNTLVTKLRVEAAASTYHTLKVYFGDGQFAVKLNGVSMLYMHRPESGTGTYAGVGTGSIASTVRFDNFTFSKHKDADVAGSETCQEYVEHCGLLTDLFARANNTDIGCAWTESAGSWAIASTAYLETASSNAVAYTNVVHPEGAYSGKVTMSVNAGSMLAGDEVVLYVSFADSTNTMKAVFKLADAGGAGGTCKLYSGGGQVGTTLALTTFKEGSAGPHSFSLCFMNQTLTANTPDGTASADTGSFGYGTRAGVGTGTITGTVDIDEFTFSKHADDLNGCPSCSMTCALVCTDTIPTQWKIEWSGLVDANGGCPDCFDADSGTIYLDFENYNDGFPACNWGASWLPDSLFANCQDEGASDPYDCTPGTGDFPPGFIRIRWNFNVQKSGSNYILQAYFTVGCSKFNGVGYSSGYDVVIVFEKNLGTSKPDCDALTTPQSLVWVSTFYENGVPPADNLCEWTNSATVLATAIP